MLGSIYLKLAITNIKKNYRVYVPYILSCIGSFIMYYVMVALVHDDGLSLMAGTNDLMRVLGFGSYIVAIFSVIFIFYANSFLMKRRTKELGLYNILGMEKKHISKIMFYEVLIISIITIILGIITSIVFSKLVTLLVIKLVGGDPLFGISISIQAIIQSSLLFIFIFFLTFLKTLTLIQINNPIELLKGSNVGEKEPKVKWVLVVLGVISLAIGYYLALSVESPLDALMLFFVAVILVIVGTYFLFIAGSIAILKMLKKNKNFYYKTQNFTSVSGMLYRMKQNAVGLATICILSTCTLVAVSTTVSMYMGIEDALVTRFERGLGVRTYINSKQQEEDSKVFIEEKIKEYGIESNNVLNHILGVAYLGNDENNYFAGGNEVMLFYTDLESFNKINGTDYVLNNDEVLVYQNDYDELTFLDKRYKVKEKVESIKSDYSMNVFMIDSFLVVVNDVYELNNVVNPGNNLNYYYGFDSTSDRQTQMDFVDKMNTELQNNDQFAGLSEGRESQRISFNSMYSGFLFLGVFIGLMFVMATVLIIYYKQISEGYDDVKRYEVMQKVGMDKREIKKTINKQILIVFFLPIVAAVIHLMFAFNMISKVLILLNLNNIDLFAKCLVVCVIVFSLLYAIVFKLTSKTYYNIVSSN